MVWSMSFQLNNIKVLFDRLFRHLWRERKKIWKSFWIRNFQINLKRNDNQSGSIFINMQCIVGSSEGKIYSRMFRIHHIPLLKLLYYTCIKRRCWITDILGDPGADSGVVFFWHQSEARTAATVWNWSGKTLSPGALLAVLYFSSCQIFFRPFRLFLVPTICPWVS